MANLLKEEYFHLGTDNIKKELWTNLYMEQKYKNYIKPLGGLWCSHQNSYSICDWIDYKLDSTNLDELDIIRYLKTCLVKFKEQSKFLVLENNNDYENLRDSGFILKLDEPIEINKWYERIVTDELIDYEKLSQIYDLIYISPYAHHSLINYSVKTMYALNPDSIEYYKPVNIDLNELIITNFGEKSYIKEPAMEYYSLLNMIKLLFKEHTKEIIYETYDEYLEKIQEIIIQLENELNNYDNSYLKNNPNKKWIIKTMLKNLYSEDYKNIKSKLLKK